MKTVNLVYQIQIKVGNKVIKRGQEMQVEEIIKNLSEIEIWNGVADNSVESCEKVDKKIEAIQEAIKLLSIKPSEDCISRKAVLEKSRIIQLDDEEDGECLYVSVVLVDDIDTLPPVIPTVPKGKWEYVKHYGKRYRVCSHCRTEKEDDNASGHNYCQYCGAIMEN